MSSVSSKAPPARKDDYALEPVPPERLTSGWRIALVSVGIVIALPAFISGAEIGFALGFRNGFVAVFLGGALLAAIAMATGTVAARTRLNTAMIIKMSFGEVGGRVVSFVLALTMLGWFGVTAELFGRGVFEVVGGFGFRGLPHTAYIAVGGALMAVTTIFGFSALQRLSNVTVPLLAILIAATAWLTVSRSGFAALLQAPGASGASLGDGISAIAGGLSVAVTIFPDFARFTRTSRDAWLAALLIYALAVPFIIVLAMIPSVLTRHRDLIVIMTTLGLGAPALALLIVKAWATNAGNLYSASLAAANSFNSHRQRAIILVGGGIGTALAIAGITSQFIPFLILLSIGIPPIAGIYVVDVLCFSADRRMDHRVASPAMRWSAFGCWTVAILVAVGARSGILTLTGVSAADSMLAAAASYFVVWRVASRRGGRARTGTSA